MRNTSIPITWSTERTLDLFYIKGRLGWKGLRASEFQEEGPFLITGTDFVGGKVDWSRSFHISDERFIESPEITVQPRDILITKDGTIGKVAFIESIPFPGKASLNSHLFLVRSRTKKIDQRFAFYIFQSYLFRRFIDTKQTGSTLSGLPQRLFEQFKVPLPPIDQQGQISEILSTVDGAIEQTEALIEKYQQIKLGLMHDLFTRGVTPDGHLRPTHTQAPHLYKESPLGWIPKEWEVRRLGAILKQCGGYLQTGPFGSQLHAREYQREGVPVVMPQDIYDGIISTEQIARIVAHKAEELFRHRMRVGDVVIARRGELSRAAAIAESHEGWLCGTGCFLLRLGRSALHSDFASCVYRHDLIQRQIAGMAVGTTMPSLNNAVMERLFFPYCDSEEQSRITERLGNFDQFLWYIQNQASKLRQQKHGLMHDLLTGRVRVKVA